MGAHLLAGAPDPSNPAFNLLPTLRALIQHHWDANSVFHDPSLPGGSVSFRGYYSNYVAASAGGLPRRSGDRRLQRRDRRGHGR